MPARRAANSALTSSVQPHLHQSQLHAGDNGRVVGYDNAHDGHHRHYFGVVEPIEFVSFKDTERRFEQDWIALRDSK